MKSLEASRQQVKYSNAHLKVESSFVDSLRSNKDKLGKYLVSKLY